MYNIVLLLSVLFVTSVYGQFSPLVSTEDGVLRGTVHNSVGSGRLYYAYRGVPFAKPPLGHLRFRAPVKNDPWNGTLDATEDKDKCLQNGGLLGISVTGSEDCLHLNVYTPNITGKLPVLVWIFGGGFTMGDKDYGSYAPDFLLDRDIIFVSINYRLGVFGFLSTGDLHSSGNWGLKDQLMALKWIKKNIRSFGGDPNRITITGQSAGSASVSYLLQANNTEGLYHGAIMQSGTSVCQWSLTREPKEFAMGLGARLGIFTTNSAELVEKLRKVDEEAIKRAETEIFYLAVAVDNMHKGMPMGPVLEPEHEGALLTEKSHELFRTGKFNKVPVIVGLTSNEAKGMGLFIDLLKPFFSRFDMNTAKLVPYDLTRNMTKRLLAGNEIKQHIFGDEPIPTKPSAKIIDFISNDYFNRPIRETVNQMSKYTNAYFYQFDYRGSLADFENSFEGVGHFEEVFYLFANKLKVNKEDDLTRSRMLFLWNNFIKYGNPTPVPLEGITWIPNSPKWNSNNGDVMYLRMNNAFEMKQNPYQEHWEFYKQLYDKYGDPPFATY